MQVFQFSDSENTLIDEKDFFIIRTETMEEDNTFINKNKVTQKSMEIEEKRSER